MNAQEMAFNAIAIGTAPADRRRGRERGAHHEEGQRLTPVAILRRMFSWLPGAVSDEGCSSFVWREFLRQLRRLCAKGRSRRSTLRSSGGRCVRCCCPPGITTSSSIFRSMSSSVGSFFGETAGQNVQPCRHGKKRQITHQITKEEEELRI